MFLSRLLPILSCAPAALLQVPHECVGYVTGRKGAGLRSVEEEWNTLMFFTDLRSKEAGETEKLAIFGEE